MGPAVAERTPRSPHYRDPPGKHLESHPPAAPPGTNTLTVTPCCYVP